MTTSNDMAYETAVVTNTPEARQWVCSYLWSAHGAELYVTDLVWVDGGWTVDGMDPVEWAQYLTQA